MPDPDEDWDGLLAAMQAQVDRAAHEERFLFETDAKGLFDIFLGGLLPESRAVHECSTCRRFMRRVGGLVSITPAGAMLPALWDPERVPAPYRDAVGALTRSVLASRVQGPFVSMDSDWGRGEAGGWTHFFVRPPKGVVFPRPLVSTETARQVAAKKRHEHATLVQALESYPPELVQRASTLLTTGALFRSEKCSGIAEWILQLHTSRGMTSHERHRENVTWRASASAPPGYCHVRGGMLGSLLDDLAADLPFDEVKAKFDAKMHPLQYMRPTAAPTAGNIAQAEKLIAALEAGGALARRFARLEDITALWKPKVSVVAPNKGGFFGHLLRRDEEKRDSGAPTVTLTWEKFVRTVLPTAEAMEMLVPEGRESFAAMVTASNPDAPPILQWDHPDHRVPVSHYLHVEGSLAKDWNLKAGAFCPVTALALAPAAWRTGRAPPHRGNMAFVLLEGARDTLHASGGGFFPECLIAELHPVRATLEAYAKEAQIEGAREATACGYMLQEGVRWDCLLRVTGPGGLRTCYRLDRWD